jgi:hypothetical protein
MDELTLEAKKKAAQAIRSRRWYLRNIEKAKQIAAAWAKANPEKRRAARERYAKRNAEGIRAKKREEARLRRRSRGIKVKTYYTREELVQRNRASARDFYRRCPEVVKARARAWNRNHPERRRADEARRRARLHLHPSSDVVKLKAIYARVTQLSAEGSKWAVDHIIPLSRGGWHHEANLQPLPDRVNSAKCDDPFWERPGFKSWRDVPQALWPAELASQYAARLT